MLLWLTANKELLNLIANWAMVAIWIVYLQVFLRSFQRQTLPKIVINRAAGSSLDAACFVSNMSPDAIYIESVIVELTYGEETFASAVTDFKATNEDGDDQNAKRRTFQGPLAPSAYTSLGTFRCLLESLSERTGCDIDPFQLSNSPIFIDVSILADYASERHLIGAKRRFRATPEAGHWTLAGEALETQQIRSYSERRRMRSLLAKME
jgi:hypothetical protein